MKLEAAIRFMDGVASENFDPDLLEVEVKRFPTNSKDVRPGEVFFAFSQPEFENNGFNGEFRDATEYVANAFENGAIGCVVRKEKAAELGLQVYDKRLIYSKDVIKSFQSLAACVFKEWGREVVAITGSAGKTTAKELTATVLEASGKRVLKSEKNFNNGLGLPITILKLVEDPGFDIAVLEMGMSTPKNEIARLCRITPPDVGVELNVLPVHVEHLGSIENVAKAKAELIEGLKVGGLAVLNNDDPRVAKMRELHQGPVLTFGIENKADISAAEINMKKIGETHFKLKTPDGDADVVFQLSGKHNILNALSACAVGYHFGMTAAETSAALKQVVPPRQRGEVLTFAEGFTVINDSYNSNPEALLRMVRTLNEGGRSATRKILVAGEMLELGKEEKEIHRRTGREIGKLGVDVMIGVRGLASEMTAGAREAGVTETAFFESPEEAGEFLARMILKGDLVLVKGSRGVRTEKAIEVLTSLRGV